MQAVCDGLYREGCISEAGQPAWERFNRDARDGPSFANEFAPTTQARSRGSWTPPRHEGVPGNGGLRRNAARATL